ncbi:GMC family oxidoreductase N-terminal domain-containing protein [Paralimibaculum aggregatum]|uniref:GMC family oxidoreductase N-terminal domain-containing protein n=2 Tax=Paralimibaculum aggregatum TaxID=3036245 RepID=A0ABQ6LSQ4_9RHOB|nr:GMC family oxidoreductase N-terminal domain-containing protein [Limibaculum sp. NKW23]
MSIPRERGDTFPGSGMAERAFDYIIVGAGSAGCVLANRLSADPSSRVLLLEAGHDTPPGNVPDDILDSYPHGAYYNAAYHWQGLRVANGAGRPGSGTKAYEQGRIMGGSSSINGMMAIRALPSDFDDWQGHGLEGWSWGDVAPYYRRLEHDIDMQGAQHGADGPLPIRRIPRADWPGFSEAACKALERAGLPFRADHNDGSARGVYPMPINNRNDRRVSAAAAYLKEEVRRRDNLTILCDTHVEAIRSERRKALGVTVLRGQERIELTGRQMIICCGALNSPALLMRSGIGDPAHLGQAGIEIANPRPGVGANLQDHPTVAIAAFLSPEARLPKSVRRHLLFGARYSSGASGCPPGDMYVLGANQVAWHSIGKQFGALLAWVNKSYSCGTVRLNLQNPQGAPDVDLNLLSDSRDLDRLVQAVRFLAEVFASDELARVAPMPFAASYSERERKLGRHTLRNRMMAALGAYVMDRSRTARNYIIGKMVAPEGELAALIADDARLQDWVLRNVTHGWHACGTCRMGARDDPGAVLDSECRVIGMEGLRVVDASIMPVIVSANTNLTTMMIAEKMADRIIAEGGRA